MKDKPCFLFSGNASTELANQISGRGILIGEICHQKFPSDEWYCQYKNNIRGADVFLLQAIIKPTNDNLMQLLIMADAARRASAGRITAVCPYLGYSRQDRKDKSRVPISAKLVMNIMAASGIDRIVTMDLHAEQIVGFTDLPFDHLNFRPTLMDYLTLKNIDIILAPDIGGVKRASVFAEKSGKDFAFIAKKRKSNTDVEVAQFVGDVKDKSVLIIDDLTESAGTLVSAAKECREQKSSKVFCAVTHACLTSLGSDRIQEAYEEGIIDKFYASNSVTGKWAGSEWATIIDVAPVFTQAIECIHNNKSLSSLFE